MHEYKMNGCIPPMITPFKEDGSLDVANLEKLVDFLSENVHGVFINGSYGCGALMSVEERKKVAEITKKTANGRIDVIVQVGTTSNRQSAELAAHAESIGAQAVAAVGPYYYQHNEDSVLYFFEDIIKAAPNTPVYVYNNPKFQGYPMSVKLIERLHGIGVHGIKDATFDIMAHATYHRLLGSKGFDVVLGTEAMWLAACVLGTKAFIPGLANAFPEIVRKMYEEGIAGEYEKCRETLFKVNEMREIMYLAKSTQLAVYAMLEIRGIITAYPRAPFISATKEQKDSIRKALIELKAL
ncbi:MAG: dihydrodipicolinate synthase family protein [Caldicoprobacterales bacterium]|jgi:dihydrodipicolinate synthase/N-acetylneuraminate lyase|nr:dihydrodipicolinate synthase family protein [Clostridiales bacterium]